MERAGNIAALVIVFSSLLWSGCSKEEERAYSGTALIDNTIYGQTLYYAIGFSFDEGKLLPTHKDPAPDITIHADTIAGGIITGAHLDTPVLVPPFALAAELTDQAGAKEFFDNLLEVGIQSWSDNANPVKVNQVWLFRTSKGNYAKFRVISIFTEMRSGIPFVEMNFEWKIQPDGSKSFSQ